MNDKKAKENMVPKCPSQRELPPSRLVWQGTYRHLHEHKPCRIVLTYTWTLPARATEWVATKDYNFERAPTTALLGELRWETGHRDDIPGEFFEEVIAAFDTCRQKP